MATQVNQPVVATQEIQPTFADLRERFDGLGRPAEVAGTGRTNVRENFTGSSRGTEMDSERRVGLGLQVPHAQPQYEYDPLGQPGGTHVPIQQLGAASRETAACISTQEMNPRITPQPQQLGGCKSGNCIYQ